ncbi:MAG TPA: prolyl oligopeptidase family serine peptidase [Chryseosolibacter sp.]
MSKFIFTVCMLFSIFSFAQTDTVPLFDKLLYTSGKDILPYRFMQPESTHRDVDFPLVIFLHGSGERGNDNEAQIRHIAKLFSSAENRKKFPCYVLAPQCPIKAMWAAHDRSGNRLVMRATPTRPMALLIELIEKIEKEYRIDRSRIYITGLSMGGYGTWDLLARFPDKFAGAIPICGGGDPATASAIKHIPIWAFHGSLDSVVDPRQSRIMVKALQEAGGKPGYTEYPDVGHDSWGRAYQEPYLLPWLFNQRLEKNFKAN